MSYIGQGEDGTWSRWLNAWREVPGESGRDHVRRSTDEYARQTAYRKLVEKARGASQAAMVAAGVELADALRVSPENTKEVARLARKVGREADRITALKRAHVALDQAVADGVATRLPDQQDPRQEAT